MPARQRHPYFRELAPKLVTNGYEVVPVVAGGKRPALGAQWQNQAASTIEDVNRLTPQFGRSSVGILTRTTPALDFDIMNPQLAATMLDTLKRICGGPVIVRYGHRPMFLVPGRWNGDIAPAKRTSRGFIDPKADPNDAKVIVNRIEALGDGQQFVSFGDHDKAETQYSYPDEKLSPLVIPHDQLIVFNQKLYDRIFDEFEWAAEQELGLIEYVRPGLSGLHGTRANGTVYEPLALPGRPPETDYEIARVRTALAYYSARSIGRNYDAYIEIAFAIEWLHWSCGLELFMEWSAKSPWHVEKNARYWFTHPTRRNDRHPITISTLFARAKEERGWDGTVPFDEIEEIEDGDGDQGDQGEPSTIDESDVYSDVGSDADKPAAAADKPKAKDGVKQRLAKMIKRYAVVRVGKQAMIYQDFGPKLVPESMTTQAFRTLQANNFIDVPNKKNPKIVKRVQLHDVFMKSTERPTYNRVVFQPEGKVAPDEYNLWRGLQVDPVAGDVTPWLDLLAGLMPNEADRVYVLNWLALKLQHPGLVPGTFLIMQGDMGIGKSALFAPILRIFGEHGKAIDKANQLVGQFSGHIEHTCFALLEEGVFAGDPRHIETLQHMVTAETLTLESKGVDARKVVNHCAFANLTNHEYAWHTTVDERRAVILRLADTLKGNRAFWNRYWSWLNSRGGVPALLHFLQTLDVSDFNVRDIPKGTAYHTQLEATINRDPVAAFLAAILEEGRLPGRSLSGFGAEFVFNERTETRVPRELLKESYEEFTRRGFGNFVPSFQTAMAKIYKLLEIENPKSMQVKIRPLENIGERVNGTKLPSLVDMRAAFYRTTGVLIDGSENDENAL